MDKYTWSDERSHTAFPIARAGYGFIFAGAFVTVIFALLEFTFLTILGLVFTFFTTYFFRDPDRVIPSQDGIVVSPADGKVIRIDQIDQSEYYQGACLKISIFMSVFNVHVNRIPFQGRITKIDYFPGRFFNASLDKASKNNERNAIHIETDDGKHICAVQIAGLIARRIICKVQESDRVVRGQRFGLICFGSRLDVYLPADTKANVAVGDMVKAGTSVLGEIK